MCEKIKKKKLIPSTCVAQYIRLKVYNMKRNRGTEGLLAIFLLSTFYAVGQVAAHPICVDSDFPVAPPVRSFCPNSSYTSALPHSSCCSASDEEALTTAFAALADGRLEADYPQCAELHKQVMCGQCDPFAGHIFDAEAGASPRPLSSPILCPTFCSSYVAACGTVLGLPSSFCADNTPSGVGTDPTYCLPMAPAEEAPPSELALAFPLLERLHYLIAIEEHPVEDRLYIVQQNGYVSSIPNAQNASALTPFLDLSDRVLNSGEQGLLGLSFSPQPNSSTGRHSVYVNYVTNSGSGGRRSVIARYSMPTALTADRDSEEILLTVSQPFSNHNGGWLGFNPADANGEELLVALGDGGSRYDPDGNGQNEATLLGSIVAINTASFNVTHYATGMRNPWRCSFDTVGFVPAANQGLGGEKEYALFCGDVGQGQREEIDVIIRGRNYGWDHWEGTCGLRSGLSASCGQTVAASQAPYTGPIFEYPRTSGAATVPGVYGRSVTGGVVYRGPNRATYGSYYFADYVDSRIFRLIPSSVSAWAEDVTWTAELVTSLAPYVSSFGRDRAGNLYVLGYSKTGDGEHIYMLGERSVIDPGDYPPPSSGDSQVGVIVASAVTGSIVLIALGVFCFKRNSGGVKKHEAVRL